MIIKIHELYPDTIQTIEGTEGECHDQLAARYPWLAIKASSVVDMVRLLDRAQAYAASITDGEGDQKAPKVHAVTADGDKVAQALSQAYKDGFVLPVKLSGKHSAGSFIARDANENHAWLLKPDSGGQSPALGVSEDKSSQCAREACFYQICAELGIGKYFPEAHWVKLDGKDFAALSMLSLDYTTMDRRAKIDPTYASRLFHVHLHSGDLLKWAFIDAVLGNCDRHGNNIMVNDKNDLQLIDQGSTFAGKDFAPGKDKNTFVPYYLRAWAPKEFNQLPPDKKLKYMPQASGNVNFDLGKWIAAIDPGVILKQCTKYGIDATASLDRLHRLQIATLTKSPDVVINSFWVGLD